MEREREREREREGVAWNRGGAGGRGERLLVPVANQSEAGAFESEPRIDANASTHMDAYARMQECFPALSCQDGGGMLSAGWREV